jgi:phosphoribosyl-ATP pyrophosphohydrolase
MAKAEKKKPGAKRKQSSPKAVKTVKVRAVAVRQTAPVIDSPRAVVLDRLWNVVLSRRDADPAVSHSARLLARGPAKVAQKFGEEAVECLIEAVSGNHEALVAESADVLYHLLVVWVAAGVRPDEVWAELERREGVSGITEKASRPRDLPVSLGPQTKKIP